MTKVHTRWLHSKMLRD